MVAGVRLRTPEAILAEVRSLLARDDNDFTYSPWSSAKETLTDFDATVALAATGNREANIRLAILFAPTGSLQETSISSGWGERLIDLANQFESVVGSRGM